MSRWFWGTPEWQAYSDAYGRGHEGNFGPANLVVELTDPTVMWPRIRHGHQADIRKGERICDEVFLLTAANYEDDEPLFAVYQWLHEKAAGGRVRSQVTFDLMREWVRDGFGMLLLARYNLHFRAAAYFIRHGAGAYYASGPRHPVLTDQPLMHALIWRAMRELYERGYRWLDMGPVPGPDATEKETSIAHFKKGFGAVAKTWEGAYR